MLIFAIQSWFVGVKWVLSKISQVSFSSFILYTYVEINVFHFTIIFMPSTYIIYINVWFWYSNYFVTFMKKTHFKNDQPNGAVMVTRNWCSKEWFESDQTKFFFGWRIKDLFLDEPSVTYPTARTILPVNWRSLANVDEVHSCIKHLYCI